MAAEIYILFYLIEIDLMKIQYQNEVVLDGNQVNEGSELQVRQTY